MGTSLKCLLIELHPRMRIAEKGLGGMRVAADSKNEDAKNSHNLLPDPDMKMAEEENNSRNL